MDWLDALILGIVQGLAEYLPISSSGHLEIFKQVLGLELDPGQSLEFSVMLHVATVLSTIVVLWRDLPLFVCRFSPSGAMRGFIMYVKSCCRASRWL